MLDFRPRHSGMVAALVLAATSACGTTPATPDAADTVVYLGAVAGTDAVVALAVRDRDVVAYVCGGAATFSTMTRWFGGQLPAAGGPVELTVDGFTLRAGVDAAGAMSGALTDSRGTRRDFAATPRQPGTLAGLYAVVDDGCRTGVVVLQPRPGDRPSVQGTWCGLTGAERFQQVIPVMPISLVNEGLRVQVQLTTGVRMLEARPVVVPLR